MTGLNWDKANAREAGRRGERQNRADYIEPPETKVERRQTGALVVEPKPGGKPVVALCRWYPEAIERWRAVSARAIRTLHL